MIGGIFNVLGQAQQQAQAQQQKNMDAQNEMNRIMAMAGYKQNEADPAATQGGAGFMSSLKNTFGSTPYEFDPSQYAFDPNSPQGQQLQLEKDRVSIAQQRADTEDLRAKEVARHNKAVEGQQFLNYLQEGDQADALADYQDRQLGIQKQNHLLNKHARAWDLTLRQQGIDLRALEIKGNSYKVHMKDGRVMIFNPFKHIESGDGFEVMGEVDPPNTGALKAKLALAAPGLLAALEDMDDVDLDDNVKKQIVDAMISTFVGALSDDDDKAINQLVKSITGKNITEVETGDTGTAKEEDSESTEGSDEYQYKWDGRIYGEGRWLPGLHEDMYHWTGSDERTGKTYEESFPHKEVYDPTNNPGQM